MGSGVLSAPQDTAVFLWGVNTSGHWVLLGEVQARVCRESRKWPCPSQMPPPPESAGFCLKLGGVCQRVEARGQEEGLPPTRLVVLWLALSCTLSLSLSELTSQEFAPEPELQTGERVFLCSCSHCTAFLIPPQAKGNCPKAARPGQGARDLGQSVLMDQKNPKWEVFLPGESPRMAPRRAMEEGCGSWDGAQTSRRQRWQNAEL